MSTEPHSPDDLSDVLRLRREKLDALRARGVNPYPYRFEKDTHIPDLLADFDSKLETEEHVGPQFSIAGRIHTMRVMGKAAFCHVRDEFGLMQVYVQRDRVGEEAYAVFKQLDLGDIVGFRGTAFRTRTGEPSLRAQSFELLSKSLHPLPVVKEREGQVFDAFTDKEVALPPALRRSRRQSRRARHFPHPREDHHRHPPASSTPRGYLEVETPALQPLYGGALARPFVTHYNALDRDFFLRIADELYLKRLLVGGFEARLRNLQGLPQRGHGPLPQSRIHHARVLPGLRRLRGDHGPRRGAVPLSPRSRRWARPTSPIRARPWTSASPSAASASTIC